MTRTAWLLVRCAETIPAMPHMAGQIPDRKAARCKYVVGDWEDTE